MVGVPVLLNLVYLVPFLLAPMVNMGIVAIALALRLMPAAVYPVPDGTPSLLYAFIGTGGSLRALSVSLFCFAVDVAIFIPFLTDVVFPLSELYYITDHTEYNCV